MKLKRWICILTVLAMVSAILPLCTGFAAEVSYDSTQVKLLQTLNILSINENNNDFSLDGTTTRAQFALYVARLLMIDDVKPSEQYFTDVPKDHFACGMIQGLVDLNIISKSDDGMFYPDESITYEQAIKIMVSALGYYIQAIDKGGFPVGYLYVAKDLELTDGINADYGAPLSKADAVQLLYNSLNVNRMELYGVSGKELSYRPGEGNTFLALRKVYCFEGQVNAIDETGLNDSGGVGKDEVRIGNEVFAVGETDARNYFGEYIVCYYKEEASQKQILMVKESRSKVTKLDAESIISFEGGKYRYTTEDGSERKVSIAAGYDIIYNDKVPTQFEESKMIPTEGSVKIIDNSAVSADDVVILSEYRNYQVEVADRTGNSIYCKDGTKFDLEHRDYGIFNSVGNSISFDSVKEKNVISVYESDDGSYLKFYVSSVKAEGVIQTTVRRGGVLYLNVGGTEYRASATFNPPAVGKTVILYLNAEGRVAFSEEDAGVTNDYGYLRGMLFLDGLSPKLQLKILTAEGTMEIFNVSEHVNCNDQKIKVKDLRNRLQNLEKKVIKYQCNSKKEINVLYIYDQLSKDYIWQTGEGKFKYNAKQQTFNGQITLSDKTIVFSIPDGDNGADEDYKVGNKSAFTNDKFYVIDTYTFGDTPFAEVVLRGSGSLKEEKTLSVVCDVLRTYDTKKEIERVQLDLLHGGQRQLFYLKNDDILGDVERGDVISISLDVDSVIESILPVYDRSTDTFLLDNPYVPESANKYYSYNRFIMANVYDVKDGLARITISDPTMPETSLVFENVLAPKFTVYTYAGSRDGDGCSVGSYLDLKSYRMTPTDYSRVIVSTNWGDPADLIILN